MANFDHQNLTDDERMQLARVEHYIDEYAAAKDHLLRSGLSVGDYVATALRDCGNNETPAALVSALEKVQTQFGVPLSAANPLAFDIGSGRSMGELPGTKQSTRAFGHTY